MARPKKQGLDYFTCDVNFYQDIKIRKLIRYKGVQAVPVYHYLLCQIYASGYFLMWDDELPFIVFEATGLQEETVIDIIGYCVEIDLFSRVMFDEYKVLTSKGIQERYFFVNGILKRKVDKVYPYSLLSTDGVSVYSDDTVVSSEETRITSEETAVNTEETRINSAKSEQIKEKERKDNNSLRSSLSPPSPPPPAHVREDGKGDGYDGGPLSVADAVLLLKDDRDWLLQMQRKFRLDARMISRWLDSFVVDCDCRGKQEHEGLSDVMQHFNDWMSKQSVRGGGRKSGSGVSAPPSPQQLWIQCHAELCKAVTADVSRQGFDLMAFESFDPATRRLVVQVPSDAVRDYLETHHIPLMFSVMGKYFGNVSLCYRITGNG